VGMGSYISFECCRLGCAKYRELIPPIRILIGGINEHADLYARNGGEGGLDNAEKGVDIPAHCGQSADREDRDETKDDAVLDHALALFLASETLDEMHDLIILSR